MSRPGHWYTNMFEVRPHESSAPRPSSDGGSSSNTGSVGSSSTGDPATDGVDVGTATATGTRTGETTTLMFARGGFQGAEGAVAGEAWYIENVLEELDTGREWYFDEGTQTLVYMPNTTDPGALVRTA